MAINFPDSPTNGQVATIGGKNYTYNSTKNTWTPTQVTEADLSSVGSTTVVATHDLLPSSPSAGDMALVSSVNKMYVYFLSGWWLMSSLQNASPSGITGNAAIYDLAADGTPTTVTLSSSDPEGFPISWSHSVISGSLGGTTVTNVDNVFTITPSTDAADAGTFTLRFAATDGQGGESGSQSNFTLDFVFIVANSRYTTLLATATGTSDNNNITDASTNNHSITVNGDAHAGTFSPYRSGGYSTYFEGNGDYLSISSNASLNFDYGAFTIECWVQSSVKINYQTVAAKYNQSDTTGFFMLLDSSGNLLFGTNPSSYITSSGTDICDGAWHHISCTRSVSSGVGTITIYIDGSSAGTLNRLDNVYNVVDFEIGRQNAVGRVLTGYVSDLRVVKGTAITPPSGGPTERLEAVTNTSLLTCHLPYISDGSTNDHSITINGNVSSKPFSPHDYNEYSATDHGGSVHFAGTADNFNVAGSSDFAPNTDEFTIKLWYYPKVQSSSATYLVRQGTSTSTAGYWAIAHYSSGRIRRMQNVGGGFNGAYSADNTIKIGQWNYIEFYQNGASTGEIKVNGVSVLTGVNYVGNTDNLQFGSSVGTDADLFISDIQIIKGSDGRESSVPTAPMSSVSNTKLHIKGTDASIIDKSQSSNLKLIGGPTGSTTQAKFANTKSIDFGDGSQTYVMEVSSGAGYTGEFTIEFWMYNTYVTSTWQSLISNSYVSGSEYFRLYKQINNGQFALYHNSTSAKLSSIGNIVNNTWTHVAIARDSSNDITVYQDGTSIGSYNNNQLFGTASSPVNVGKGGVGDTTNYPMSGYIQDLRITDGLARYTANFTPPTASLEG